jgi:hypothetical protein
MMILLDIYLFIFSFFPFVSFFKTEILTNNLKYKTLIKYLELSSHLCHIIILFQ